VAGIAVEDDLPGHEASLEKPESGAVPRAPHDKLRT
jgi:hypothetical protein